MTSADFLTNHAEADLTRLILEATEAAGRNHQKTQLAHVAQVLLGDASVAVRLPETAAMMARARLSDFIRDLPRTDGRPGDIAFSINSLFEPAIDVTRAMGGPRVTPVGFLATCLSSRTLVDDASIRTQEILRNAGVVLELVSGPARVEKHPLRDYLFRGLGFGFDLTAMARDGWWSECPVVGMEDVLEKLSMFVSAGMESVVLVGDPGVGKSALVEGLAFYIARKARPLIPSSIDKLSIVMISSADLRADTGVQGALESRIKNLLQFFQENRNVIPFFDEVHTLLNTEDASTQVLSTAIKPAMARGAFRCIGATTGKEYARFITSDEAMKRRFVPLLVPEPDEAQTLQIVRRVLGSLLEGQPTALEVRLSDQALETAVAVTTRFMRTEFQPAKSINLLRQVIMERVFRLLTSRETAKDIGPDDIGSWFSRRSGIPIDSLNDKSAGFYNNLRKELGKEIFGQPQAIEDVVSWLALQGAGWLDPRRPRGRFVFLGPSGVGKSELASQLADKLMNDRSAVIVRNMGDFSDQSARSSWQGAAPGYIGFGTTSTVYSEVLVRPYSVVILDEFEKAHESLTELLLAMFDGYGQDAQGKRVDFSQCVFVVTSNAFDHELSGLGEDEVREALLAAGRVWQPQLLDRIDRVIAFQSLDQVALAQILTRMIEKRQRVAARPLPSALDDMAVRAGILSSAMSGGGSARRLERALADWLVAQTRESAGAGQSTEPIAGRQT